MCISLILVYYDKIKFSISPHVMKEAMSLQGVGKRLADKIWEIAQSGELRKLQELRTSEEVQTLERFTNVWGAGPSTAQQWYQQVNMLYFFHFKIMFFFL